MNIRYAIDGATRRNGKPDCVAGGAAVCQIIDDAGLLRHQHIMLVHEYGSTNQRGEMLALLEAIEHFVGTEFDECQIITDSEYLFNTIQRDWLTKWSDNWLTSKYEPVKNSDIWRLILQLLQTSSKSVNMYHIKGHIIPMGKATTQRIIATDTNGRKLYAACSEKYHTHGIDDEKLTNLQELSLKNNGFELTPDILETFVVLNTMADVLAGYEADRADVV